MTKEKSADRKQLAVFKSLAKIRKYAQVLTLLASLWTIHSLYLLDKPKSSIAIQNNTETFLKVLDTNYARNWSEIYTSQPHLAGTNFPLAKYTQDKFIEYGFESIIDTYETYMSYPLDHALKLYDDGEMIYEAPLTEDDIYNGTGITNVPTFLAYSANGNVTSEYIYANYGTKQDFIKLVELGIDTTGKIAIVRYGAIFRGLKVKFAQEFGCIGILIYSDPGDDNGITPANGYAQYPLGPARQESSVQRGSIQFLSVLPGDPTTPGYGSKPGVPRTDPLFSTPSIPALPVSYRDIAPILVALNGVGEVVPGWAGEIEGVQYNVGPSTHQVNVYSEQVFNITPIWNVYGEIKGVSSEIVIVGNHRDAWVGGAGDPNSGSAVMIEVARGFSELVKTGWKPHRTIIFASWDGEEYGLLGSTEFGEFNGKWIKDKVVAYINLDVAVTGSHFRLKSSPVLNSALMDAAKLISYPKGGSLYEHFTSESKVGLLGSGSDYTVFLQHLGVASTDMTFTFGKDDKNIYHYHSNYDSFQWMDTIADPGFVYHNVMSKYLGALVLQLSESTVVEFQLSDYGRDLSSFFEEFVKMVPSSWLAEKIDAASKSCHTTVETFEELVKTTQADLSELHKRLIKYDSYVNSVKEESSTNSVLSRIRNYFKIKKINYQLQKYEQQFIYEDGLNNRGWFKHIVYASGRNTGYACQTLPGLKEAAEDGDFDGAVHWIGVLKKVIGNVDHLLR